MRLHLSSRRLLQSASTLVSPISLVPAPRWLALSRSLHTTPSHAWWGRKAPPDDVPVALPKTVQESSQQDRNRDLRRLVQVRLEEESMFGDEVAEMRKQREEARVVEEEKGRREGDGHEGDKSADGEEEDLFAYEDGPVIASKVRDHVKRAIDPDPLSRARWQRKMVIRQVTCGTDPWSREPRRLRIRRTEREATSRSTWLRTSVKKLAPLARQIQGKTLDDAMVQMRFSKKKMAAEVHYQLEEARDEAIVARGMGLGSARGDVEPDDHVKPIRVQTKDGKWVDVKDPTRIYVAEAWVNRGPWLGAKKHYRARGKIDLQPRPQTSITVVLKEEKSRIREHQEREAKRLRQGPWIPLPDRPITAQRQYYSW